MRSRVFIAVLFLPSTAAASSTASSLTVDAHAQWLRAFPTVHTKALSNDLRGELPAASHEVPGGAMFGGAQAIYGVVVNDRVVYPLFGFGIATTVGRYSVANSTVDGSIAALHPWTARYFTLLLPGMGLRAKDRRWMGQLVIRPGAAWLSLDGVVASGVNTNEITATSRVTFIVRAEAEACRRFDPVSRLCGFLAPSIYEHRWFSGAQLGIRWEMGP